MGKEMQQIVMQQVETNIGFWPGSVVQKDVATK
jgi:hypothetical protein